jgi:hypothetical protein
MRKRCTTRHILIHNEVVDIVMGVHPHITE